MRRFDGRDHVPLRQLRKFYGIEARAAGASETAFAPGRDSLLFRAGSREVMVHGLRLWMGFPLLASGDEFWVPRLDLSRTLEPALRPQLIAGMEAPRTIVLDPGHGGTDRGARSVYQYEKNFTLDLARRLRDRLVAKGFRVVLTRNSDIFMELEARARVAARHPAPVFVSLHFNAAANPAAQGFEVFSLAPRGAPPAGAEDLMVSDLAEHPGQPWELQSLALGQAVYHAMHGRLAMVDRGMKRARFAVLRHARCPAVLVEGGFLTNPLDARRIASPAWRNRLADAIGEGIAAYAALAAGRKPPPLVSDYRLGARTRVRLSVPAPTPSPPPPPALKLRELPPPPDTAAPSQGP